MGVYIWMIFMRGFIKTFILGSLWRKPKNFWYAFDTKAEILYFVLMYHLLFNTIFSKSYDSFKVLSFLCHLDLSSCLLVCFCTLARVRNFERLFCFTDIQILRHYDADFVKPTHNYYRDIFWMMPCSVNTLQ